MLKLRVVKHKGKIVNFEASWGPSPSPDVTSYHVEWYLDGVLENQINVASNVTSIRYLDQGPRNNPEGKELKVRVGANDGASVTYEEAVLQVALDPPVGVTGLTLVQL